MDFLRSRPFGHYAFLALLCGVLVRYGFFYPSWLVSLSLLVSALFVFSIDQITIPRGWASAAGGFLALLLIHQGSTLLYPEWGEYRWVLAAVLTLVFAGSLISSDRLSNRTFLYCALFLFVACGIFVIEVSPNPRIDVYDVLRHSVNRLLEGQSPYDKDIIFDREYFEQRNLLGMYELYKKAGILDGGLAYSPLLIFGAALGHLFGDVRYGAVIFVGLMFLVAHRLFGQKDEIFRTLLFVLFAISLFGIEQAWTDYLPMFFGALTLWAALRGRERWTPILVGLTCLSKLYMAPLAGFYLASVFWKNPRDFLPKGLWLTLGYTLPLVIIAFWGVDELKLYLLKDMWHFNDFEYPFSNSLTNHIKRGHAANLYFLAPVCLFGIFGWFALRARSGDVLKAFTWFTLTLFLFFFTNKAMFYNYAWMITGLMLFSAAVHERRRTLALPDLLFGWSRLAAIVFMPAILSDVWRYTDISSLVLTGKVPYIDFTYEYPPFSLVQILMPAYVSSLAGKMTFEFYRLLFMLLTLAFDLHLYLKLRARGKDVALYYTVASALMAPFFFERLDLVMMWFVAMTILSLERKNFLLAGIHTILGGWHKLIPFLSVVGLFKDSPSRKKFVYAFMFVNLVALTIVSFFFESQTLSFLSYHSERPFQFESLVASLVNILHLIVPVGKDVVASFGSQNIVFPGWEIVLLLNKILLAFSLLALTFGYWKNRLSFAGYFTLTMMVLVSLSSVFSTQYLIWILVPLVLSEVFEIWSSREKNLFLFITLLSTIIFCQYFPMVRGDVPLMVILLARNVLLLWLCAITLKRLMVSNRA